MPDINPSQIAQQGAQTLGGIAGVIQAIGSIKAAKRENANLDRLFKLRKPFKTPDEIFNILGMTTNAAQSGYGPDVLGYLTGQAGTGLSSTLGTAERLGADPNALSGILNSYFQDIFKIGSEDEVLKLSKFDKVINATQLLAQNREAEQVSKDNLIKDQMAASAARLQNAQQGIQSGLNLMLNAVGSGAIGNSYGSVDLNTLLGKKKTSLGAGEDSGLGGGGMTPSQLLKLKQLKEAGLLD